MALPIPIVVSNFAEFYKETEKKEKQLARKAEKESRLREEERDRYLATVGEVQETTT